jgi:hypothetical protein
MASRTVKVGQFAGYWMVDDEADEALSVSSIGGGASRRFLSRSRMNSSYFVVPGRRQSPAQCGRVSLTPAARFDFVQPAFPPRNSNVPILSVSRTGVEGIKVP